MQHSKISIHWYRKKLEKNDNIKNMQISGIMKMQSSQYNALQKKTKAAWDYSKIKRFLKNKMLQRTPDVPRRCVLATIQGNCLVCSAIQISYPLRYFDGILVTRFLWNLGWSTALNGALLCWGISSNGFSANAFTFLLHRLHVGMTLSFCK